MPTLHEIQRAVHRSLIACDDTQAAEYIVADDIAAAARLNIYRNTFAATLTNALRLSFPSIHRLVGDAFFESAARMFIEQQPPQRAYLDEYGAAFPEFLAGFVPAASLPYLPDVAELEWAVNRALHAPDADMLDLSHLAAIDPADQDHIGFVPHPSVSLVRSNYPVDMIWRAVLAGDDAGMAQIELSSGSVWLLVQRSENRVEVTPCSESAWRFASELFATRPFWVAIDAAPEIDASILLADHIAAGRLIGFRLVDLLRARELPEEQSR